MAEQAGSMRTCSTEQPYKCALCQDTGWIRCEVAPGYSGVRECGCVKARKAAALLKKSGLAEALEQQTFDSFSVSTDMQEQIKSTARRYLNSLFSMPSDSPRKPWLYIGGNPGSGKTHICTAVCGELLKANVEVVYMQWLSEARRLKAYVNEPDFEGMLDRFVDCDVLYIDDLFKQTYRGTPILTDADVRIAFTVFNERYLQDKPTIISSEWSLESLLDADEGVFSRIYERCKGYTVTVPREIQHNFRLSRVKGPQVSAQQYGQRQYTEAELLAVSDDLLAEARKARETA